MSVWGFSLLCVLVRDGVHLDLRGTGRVPGTVAGAAPCPG